MTQATDSQFDPEMAGYRSLSLSALAALVLGLFSFLAMIHVLLWIVPALGIALAVVALRSIRASEGTLTGRLPALIGLGLAVLFASAAFSSAWSYRYWLDEESRPLGRLWFQLLQRDEPHKALQLERFPSNRQPLDANLWSFYRDTEEARGALERFVADPLVRALLALGPQAEVELFAIEKFSLSGDTSFVSQVYRVAYEDAGQTKTFFVRLVLERNIRPDTGRGQWRVVSYEGGVRPFDES